MPSDAEILEILIIFNKFMENLQFAIAAATFVGVIVLIITEWIHLTVAAFLGALVLVFTHVMTLNDAIEYIGRSHGTLGLFFGVMVMVRSFEPTKVSISKDVLTRLGHYAYNS